MSLALTDNRNEHFQDSGSPDRILAVAQRLLDWNEYVQSQQGRNGQQRRVGRAHHARGDGAKPEVGNNWIADVLEGNWDN